MSYNCSIFYSIQQFHDKKKLNLISMPPKNDLILLPPFFCTFSSNFIISIFPRSSHLGTTRWRRWIVISLEAFISYYLCEMKRKKEKQSIPYPFYVNFFSYNKAICCRINFSLPLHYPFCKFLHFPSLLYSLFLLLPFLMFFVRVFS